MLSRIRALLAAYPDDIRRFAVASGWRRVEQELPFVRRTESRGDDTGSRAVAARLAITAMHLAFLLERQWAPYSKWLGTAFAALPRVGRLASPLGGALTATSGEKREAALVEVVEGLARLQGSVGLPTLEPATERFWDREVRGVRPVSALVRETITDADIRSLPLFGTPEQWTDNVDVLTRADLRIPVVRELVRSAR